MTFFDWLQRQAGRDTPVGDLARDSAIAPETHDLPDTLPAWDAFLRSRQACPEARDALRTAWKSYRSYQSRHPEG